jgi:hypothetical protein
MILKFLKEQRLSCIVTIQILARQKIDPDNHDEWIITYLANLSLLTKGKFSIDVIDLQNILTPTAYSLKLQPMSVYNPTVSPLCTPLPFSKLL